MKNKTLIMLVVVAALATCLALVGCGGSQSSAASSASGSTASSTQAASSTATNSGSAAASNTSTSASAQAASSTSATTPASSAAASSGEAYIGENAAKEIALSDAGVAESNCTELEVKLDTDDGIVHYDVDFKAGGMEYDYDINPTTGAILKAASEVDD